MNDLDEIDSALRLVNREVWVVTAADGERRGGLVATWVTAASIDRERPMLLAALGANHFTTELVQASKAFAAHLLRPEQTELAWNFARDSGRQRDKLAGIVVERQATGAPVLADCLAWFDCRVFARYDAGDRLLFWGDVVAGTLRVPSPATIEEPGGRRSLPTTYALCEQEFFASLTDAQRQQLKADRDRDAATGRPLHEAWRLKKPW
jgi:flavin reductase (DIM6/NTAB) family NADH-FMN oxidoreductase RutF